MKKYIFIVFIASFVCIVSIHAQYGIGQGEAQIFPIYQSNYAEKAAAIHNGQPNSGSSSGSSNSNNIIQTQSYISIAVSLDNKRIKVKYDLDQSGKVNMYNNPLQIWDGYNWIVTYGGIDQIGQYVSYASVKYYF